MSGWLVEYRLSDDESAELEASVAADTAGFACKVGDIGWWGHDNEAYGVVAISADDGTVTPRALYRVALHLVVTRVLIVRRPGYGR